MEIFEAARLNDAEKLKELLQTENTDQLDNRGSSPLIVAVYYGNKEAVQLLTDANANTDIQDSMGNTALMGACFKGHTAIAKILLEKGANPDVLNSNHATALTFAATFGHLTIVELLVQHGANLTATDRFGKNPIDYTVIQENEACYEFLVDALKKRTTSKIAF